MQLEQSLENVIKILSADPDGKGSQINLLKEEENELKVLVNESKEAKDFNLIDSLCQKLFITKV